MEAFCNKRIVEEENPVEARQLQAFANALGQLGEAVALVNDGRVLHVNPVFEELTGYLAEELITKRIAELISPPAGPRATVARKAGPQVEVEVASATLSDAGGIEILILRAAPQYMPPTISCQENQLQRAQRIGQIGSWEWSIDDDRLTCSDELYRVFGFEPGEMAMEIESMMLRIHPEDRKPVRFAIQKSIEQRQPFSIEFRLMRKDGEVRDYIAKGDFFEDQGETKLMGVVQDITQRRRAERLVEVALIREREIARQLRDADLLRTDFLSTVAHELRTPVTTINGFVRTLDARWDHLDEDTRREFMTRIYRATVKLGQTVEELLDFSRLERGKPDLNPEDVELANAIQCAVDLTPERLCQHRLELDIEPGLTVVADRRALVRIIDNIITNAVKFSPPGSVIRASSEARPMEIWVHVDDEGMGIPEKERQRVFDRFYRIKRGNTAPSGTGIGLAIVKELVEAQGGNAWVGSSANGGTRISFSLPRKNLFIDETPTRPSHPVSTSTA